MEAFNLKGEVKQVATPVMGYTSKQVSQARDLTKEQSHQNWRLVGQLMEMAHGRTNLQFGCKEAARTMSAPTEIDWMCVKRLAKFVARHECPTELYECRRCPNALTTYVDSDWAGEQGSRRSS